MFIIDFDDTLFDTQAFIKNICSIFVSVGVVPKDARSSMKTSILNDDKKTYNYTFEYHTSILREMNYHFDEQYILEGLYNLTKHKDYSFQESVEFLERLSAFGQTLLLLSVGNEAFQRMKYESTPFPKYFDEVVFLPSGKDTYVASIASKNGKIFFINDKSPENEAVKKRVPDAIVITKHNPYKAVGDHMPTMKLPTFDSLLEIADYVEHTSK